MGQCECKQPPPIVVEPVISFKKTSKLVRR